MKNNQINFAIVNDNRKDIMQKLNNKSGIYQITNIVNKKIYVGSSINLARRLFEYVNINRLIRELKRGESIIYKSIIKYGLISTAYFISA